MYRKFTRIWAFALFIFVSILLPLYIPANGYYTMGNDKFTFFLYGMGILVCAGIFLFIPNLPRFFRFLPLLRLKYVPFSSTDIFVLLYALSNVLSFLFSPYKSTALWGNDEWNMGLISQLLFVFIYFAISRNITRIRTCIFCIFISGIPMAVLTILNRFGFYPLSIPGKHPLYVSTIGNINWFCGFFIMITSLELYLYFYIQNFHMKCYLGAMLFLSMGAIICQGSTSGYAALFMLLLILLKEALKNIRNIQRFLEILLLLFGFCTLTYLTGYFIPGYYAESDPVTNLVAFSPLPFVCLFLTAALYILLSQCRRNISLSFLYRYIMGIFIALVLIYLLLCLVNTFWPFVTPVLNGKSLFTFSPYWFSTRGGTYAVGVEAFFSLSPLHKCTGIGPDCFLSYVYSHTANIPTASYFKIQPLANAHNELLTVLINTGILGCVFYAGIFISILKRGFSKKNPFINMLLFGILGYIINNMFSFQQVISTSFVFMLLGLCEALCNNYEPLT